jgi:hypothetical protein
MVALVGTLIAAGPLPDQTTWLPKDTYIALNVIFAAMIACAPLVYGAWQKEKDDKPEGFVILFLAGAFLTAWAALAELVTLWFLIWDINGTDGFGQWGVRVFDGIIIIALVAMGAYLFSRTAQITDKPRPKHEPRPKPDHEVKHPAVRFSGPLPRGVL